MELFEYQAKKLFAEAGIAIPAGQIIENVENIEEALSEAGLPCVIKSQVLHGGRGKAGLIQFANTAEEAKEKTKQLFDSPHCVKKILIEQSLEIDKEFYLAITVDPLTGYALVIASTEGGGEIETLAAKAPEKIIKQSVDITQGILPFQLRNIMFGLGLPGDIFKQGMKILKALFELFCKEY